MGNVRALASPFATEMRWMPPGGRPGTRPWAAATQRLSEDQESPHAAGRSDSRRAEPPSGEMRWIRAGPAAESERRNAICVPSGDQAGQDSAAGSLVRRRASASPMIFTQMSQLSPRSPRETKAI